MNRAAPEKWGGKFEKGVTMSAKVLSVFPVSGKKLRLLFSTGEIKLFDVTPYINGSWYGQLADDAFFSSVQPAGETVVWPDGQDIAPHELYENSVIVNG